MTTPLLPPTPLHPRRCNLRWYCGRECQKEDWKVHKARCNQVRDVAQAVELICDTGADGTLRSGAALKLAAPEAVQVVLAGGHVERLVKVGGI